MYYKPWNENVRKTIAALVKRLKPYKKDQYIYTKWCLQV